jgi:ABC-type phosphate transport system auxiliary subunit
MKFIAPAVIAALLLAPGFASAAVYAQAEPGRHTVNSLAVDVAVIKSELQALRAENAQLRAQLSVGSPAPIVQTSSNLDARVSSLERSMSGLQSTLGQVVTMLTLLLGRMI